MEEGPERGRLNATPPKPKLLSVLVCGKNHQRWICCPYQAKEVFLASNRRQNLERESFETYELSGNKKALRPQPIIIKWDIRTSKKRMISLIPSESDSRLSCRVDVHSSLASHGLQLAGLQTTIKLMDWNSNVAHVDGICNIRTAIGQDCVVRLRVVFDNGFRRTSFHLRYCLVPSLIRHRAHRDSATHLVENWLNNDMIGETGAKRRKYLPFLSHQSRDSVKKKTQWTAGKGKQTMNKRFDLHHEAQYTRTRK